MSSEVRSFSAAAKSGWQPVPQFRAMLQEIYAKHTHAGPVSSSTGLGILYRI